MKNIPAITSPEIDDYCSLHSTSVSQTIQSRAVWTEEQGLQSQMLTGAMQGQFLRLLCKSLNVKNALEIGTFTGFGALCMAEGIVSGNLVTIERNKKLEQYNADLNAINTSPCTITCMQGDAMDLIPTLDLEFDLVFLDANKKRYGEMYELILSKLKRNGVILADNVLWKGLVAHPDTMDKLGTALHQFNVAIQQDMRVDNVVLPIRDGINMIVKK